MPRPTTMKSSGGKAPRSSGKVTSKSKSKVKKPSKKERKSQENKTRRWKPGTVALREIKKLQKGTKLLLQKAPFQRLVRRKMGAYKTGLSFKPSALEALQEAAESYLVGLFEGAVILQLHRNKKTLTWKDLNYTRRIRGELSS